MNNWDAALYDSEHSYVSREGNSLLSMLQAKQGERILDLGCGTGDLSYEIQNLGAQVIAIDSSEAMIHAARKKYPTIHFEVQDALALSLNTKVDAVFSNAVLHWIRKPKLLFRKIHDILKPNARLIVECGAKGNINTIIQSIEKALCYFGYPENMKRNPWSFLGPRQYRDLLLNQGFHIKTIYSFPRETALKNAETSVQDFLDMFALSFFQGIPKSTLAKMRSWIEEDLKPKLFKNNTWHADYHRIRFSAIKKT